MAWPAAFTSRDTPTDSLVLPVVNLGDSEFTPSPEQLARAGKLVALGELTPGVAHELNNPLFAVLGLVDFLLAESEPGSRAHRRLTVVRETAQEMRDIMRALIDFAREPGDRIGSVELVESVRDTLALVRRTTFAKDVEIAERLGGEPLVVEGSRNELRQCVLHLVTNAFAMLQDGGTVTVELLRRDRLAVLRVSDSGPGVPKALEAAIFEPFFTTRTGGSGLGLAAGRAIAESHGGTLELDASGPGATFVLRLPVAREGTAQ
jgi:signal transduction histidine kinase